jgi:hypothetical protein
MHISNSPQYSQITPAVWRALPAGIWVLGFGSLFMDISSELIHSLLSVFMVTALGASIATVGIIEGVAEATAAVMKVFSGALRDALVADLTPPHMRGAAYPTELRGTGFGIFNLVSGGALLLASVIAGSLELSRCVSHISGWCRLRSRGGHRVASCRTAPQATTYKLTE